MRAGSVCFSTRCTTRPSRDGAVARELAELVPPIQPAGTAKNSLFAFFGLYVFIVFIVNRPGELATKL